MAITGLGTLRSLARQGLRLSEEMPVLLFEPNDIQCRATVHFAPSLTDPAGRQGAWVALLDPRDIADCTLPEEAPSPHPCLGCGGDLSRHIADHGFNYTQRCPDCGVAIMAPMAAPRGAA